MALIKSISGIRGTVGGRAGEGLTPVDVVKYSLAYGEWLRGQGNPAQKVVVGRDARVSGPLVYQLVAGSLTGLGFEVVNLDLATTPTVEMAVVAEQACGGIIITASHNPAQWNALKLLNQHGEFLSAADGEAILNLVENANAFHQIEFATVDRLGSERREDSYNRYHIDQILRHPLVDRDAIRGAGFRVAIDCVNSVGGIILPELLDALGVREVIGLYTEPNGRFPHNPEPLPEHLTELSETVRKSGADLGFVVDPDVDRLAIVSEDGEMFGEEYTLVAVADYVLSHRPGNTVSNLSSTRALQDITEKYGMRYTASAVGEVNVVAAMKATGAVIGGEGNGGVILPDLHYGRDALIGIALFLSHLAHKGMTCSGLRRTYPDYFVSKNKMTLDPDMDVDRILDRIKSKYSQWPMNESDGVRIDFPEGWVHLRKSNTEPIIRIYAEARSIEKANELAGMILGEARQ